MHLPCDKYFVDILEKQTNYIKNLLCLAIDEFIITAIFCQFHYYSCMKNTKVELSQLTNKEKTKKLYIHYKKEQRLTMV